MPGQGNYDTSAPSTGTGIPSGGSGAPTLHLAYVDNYGADPTGAADSTAAFNAAVTTLGGSTAGVGLVVFGAGTYKIVGPTTVISSPTLGIQGIPGATTIMYYGSAQCFRVTWAAFPATTALVIPVQCAPVRWFTVDMTNAGAGATPLLIGDRVGSEVDIAVQNGTGAGDIGVHFQNNFGWFENNRVTVTSENMTTAFQFDYAAAGTDSFEFNELYLTVLAMANQDGINIAGSGTQSGPVIAQGHTSIRGNFILGASANTGAVLRISFNGSGAPVQLYDRLDLTVETDGSSGVAHQTIVMATGNQQIACNGTMKFNPGAGVNFQSGTYNGGFTYTGQIYAPGDVFLGSTASESYPGFAVFGSITGIMGYAAGGAVSPYAGNWQKISLASGAQAVTIATPAITGQTQAFEFHLLAVQPSSGAPGTVSSWPFKWPLGTPPTLSLTSNSIDIIDVIGVNDFGATTYYATLRGKAYA
jgi:hypothetical protein